jgi:phosphoribosyl 1,2-cyclic phosphate phosphodiesterase
MELLFLGTAAAEGIPSMYCNCDTCRIARIKKGKNIRNRSAVLINKVLREVKFGR